MSNKRSLELISWPVTAARDAHARDRMRLRTLLVDTIHFTTRSCIMESSRVVEFSSLDETIQNLIKEAVEVRKRSYSPYSNFKVGAAVLTEEDSKMFSGCNVESATFSPSICAERAAIPRAVSAGYLRFRSVAVVAHQKDFTAPCGVCRQLLSEFRASDGDMDVYLTRPTLDQVLCTKLSHLLPLAYVSFTKDNIVT